MKKRLSCLMAIATIIGALAGVPKAMAGAYDTGEGQGYASCASTEILYSGTIFRVDRIQPDVRPTLCGGIDQLRCAVLFKCAFQPVAYYLQGREI